MSWLPCGTTTVNAMRTPAVRILVRPDIDWRQMDRDQFLSQSDPTRPLPFIRPRVLDLWDRAFGTDFFSYRAQLQDLAYGTFATAGADSISRGFGDFDAWWDDPDEQIVVPMDDDDFLMVASGPRPRVLRRGGRGAVAPLRPRAAGGRDDGLAVPGAPVHPRYELCTAVVVPAAKLHPGRGRGDPRRPHSRQRADRRCPRRTPRRHGAAGLRELQHPCVSLLPTWYSLKNGHIGSIQLLSQTLQRPDPVGYLRSRTLEVHLPPPDQLESLAPQIGAMAEIWASLHRLGPLPAP